jgi:hypothetical protein
MGCSHLYELQSQRASNNDLLYSRNDVPRALFYLAIFYHRSLARQKDKGRWVITESEEAFRFYCAHDSSNLSALYPGLWHIEVENKVIGAADELIAFFPAPKNSGDPWHGYPFRFGRAAPPKRIKALKDVAERLFQQEKIGIARIKQIRNGAI